MSSTFKKTTSRSWPDFAFKSDLDGELKNTVTADMAFFCNFEARLPHLPALKRVAGPLPYSGMLDGGILLEKTIAPGDFFEIESIVPMPLHENDTLVTNDPESIYLDAGPLEQPEIRKIAEDIAGNEEISPQLVMKFVRYLEEKGVYKSDFKQSGGMHPVKEFLTGSMHGHCQHFAASLVALLRLKGIQARVAVGYTSAKKREKRYIFIETMAHAWAEILTLNGWKAVDVKPQRSEQPLAFAPEFELPTDYQLDQVLAKLKNENAQRFPAGNDEATDESFQEEEPARMDQDEVNTPFTQAEDPGTVVNDKARTERSREAKEKARRNKEEKRQTKLRSKLLRNLLAIIIFAGTAWISRKKGEKFLNWLLKILKKKKKNNYSSEPAEAIEEQLSQDLKEILTSPEMELKGNSITELFNRFTYIMAARNNLPRNEFETPAEYFSRLCLELNLRSCEGRNASSCFEAELYGRKSISPSDIRNFLLFLQQILNKFK